MPVLSPSTSLRIDSAEGPPDAGRGSFGPLVLVLLTDEFLLVLKIGLSPQTLTETSRDSATTNNYGCELLRYPTCCGFDNLTPWILSMLALSG